MLEALASPRHVASVALIVRDLDRVMDFYVRVIGLSARAAGKRSVLLSPEGGPDLVRLTERTDATPADPHAVGLFHTAFVLPSRRDLARWLWHATQAGVALEGASDHLVSEAIYLSDTEGNGIEIYADRPRSDWPHNATGIAMATLPLDGAALMATIADESADTAAHWRFPDGGRIGHVHLKVNDLAAAESFYTGELGMDVMARYPGAVFLSWGGYHHHIAVNTWRSRGAPGRDPHGGGLAGVMFEGRADGTWTDPSGNELVCHASASIS